MANELERIAAALEMIAATLQSMNRDGGDTRDISQCTKFPWHELPSYLVARVRREMAQEQNSTKPWRNPVFDDFKWPLSCEDLIEIGRSEMESLNQVGTKAIGLITEKLAERGFEFV